LDADKGKVREDLEDTQVRPEEIQVLGPRDEAEYEDSNDTYFGVGFCILDRLLVEFGVDIQLKVLH